MKNDNTKTPFIYAKAYTGQTAKIPLKEYVNLSYCMKVLLNEGIGITDVQNVSYSTVETEPIYKLRSSFPSRANIEQAIIDNNESPFPPYPVPPAYRVFPALWSKVIFRKYTSLIDLQKQGLQFCMLRDGQKVNIFGYSKDNFVDQGQWDELQNGNIGLLYGVAWRQLNTQDIVEGVHYKQELVITQGMSKVTEYSISTTLGASGFGLSASLTATFGQKFETTQSSTFTESLEVNGIPGSVLVQAVWQLVDVFYLVKTKDKEQYEFIDKYEIPIAENPNNPDKIYYRNLIADPLFFNNNELTDDNKRIGTNITNATDRVDQNVTNIIIPINSAKH